MCVIKTHSRLSLERSQRHWQFSYYISFLYYPQTPGWSIRSNMTAGTVGSYWKSRCLKTPRQRSCFSFFLFPCTRGLQRLLPSKKGVWAIDIWGHANKQQFPSTRSSAELNHFPGLILSNTRFPIFQISGSKIQLRFHS